VPPALCENTFAVKLRESEVTDRLISKYGPVNALRLLGWLWKLELEGEDWIAEKVSRQQLAFIQRQVTEANVPWEPGTIEWPKLMRAGKRAVDSSRALNERTQERARLASRRRRPT
jgi:hypothetical protein